MVRRAQGQEYKQQGCGMWSASQPVFTRCKQNLQKGTPSCYLSFYKLPMLFSLSSYSPCYSFSAVAVLFSADWTIPRRLSQVWLSRQKETSWRLVKKPRGAIRVLGMQMTSSQVRCQWWQWTSTASTSSFWQQTSRMSAWHQISSVSLTSTTAPTDKQSGAISREDFHSKAFSNLC